MIIIVDNYDSFTFNLVQRFGEIDASLDIRVFRNDQIAVDEVLAMGPSHVIISPGPCTPNEAGISLECAKRLVGVAPLLGVCLGHQSLAQAHGAKVIRAPRLMHGKTDVIRHDGKGLFEGVENPMIATRYHSLIVKDGTLPDEFEVCAWSDTSEDDVEIMGIRHREHPAFGMQFHPESFLSESGTRLLQAFLATEVAAGVLNAVLAVLTASVLLPLLRGKKAD